MQTGRGLRWLAWASLFASATASAQTAPPFRETPPGDADLVMDPRDFIAVDPLDPEFDPNDPRYRSLVPEELRPPRPPTPVIRTELGEAYSIRQGDAGIELTLGEEPAVGETLGMRIQRLLIQPPVVRLTVGESFELDRLIVRAYGTTGQIIEHAPLRLELEAPEGFVDLAAFELDGRTLRTTARGIGRLWVTSTLPALLTENFSLPVVLIVREPGAPRRPRLSNRIYENIPATPRR